MPLPLDRWFHATATSTVDGSVYLHGGLTTELQIYYQELGHDALVLRQAAPAASVGVGGGANNTTTTAAAGPSTATASLASSSSWYYRSFGLVDGVVNGKAPTITTANTTRRHHHSCHQGGVDGAHSLHMSGGGGGGDALTAEQMARQQQQAARRLVVLSDLWVLSPLKDCWERVDVLFGASGGEGQASRNTVPPPPSTISAPAAPAGSPLHLSRNNPSSLARYNHSLTALGGDGRLVVIGGVDQGHNLQETVWVADTTVRPIRFARQKVGGAPSSSSPAKKIPPTLLRRKGHSCAAVHHGRLLVVVGGEGPNGAPKSDGIVFSITASAAEPWPIVFYSANLLSQPLSLFTLTPLLSTADSLECWETAHGDHIAALQEAAEMRQLRAEAAERRQRGEGGGAPPTHPLTLALLAEKGRAGRHPRRGADCDGKGAAAAATDAITAARRRDVRRRFGPFAAAWRRDPQRALNSYLDGGEGGPSARSGIAAGGGKGLLAASRGGEEVEGSVSVFAVAGNAGVYSVGGKQHPHSRNDSSASASTAAPPEPVTATEKQQELLRGSGNTVPWHLQQQQQQQQQQGSGGGAESAETSSAQTMEAERFMNVSLLTVIVRYVPPQQPHPSTTAAAADGRPKKGAALAPANGGGRWTVGLIASHVPSLSSQVGSRSGPCPRHAHGAYACDTAENNWRGRWLEVSDEDEDSDDDDGGEEDLAVSDNGDAEEEEEEEGDGVRSIARKVVVEEDGGDDGEGPSSPAARSLGLPAEEEATDSDDSDDGGGGDDDSSRAAIAHHVARSARRRLAHLGRLWRTAMMGATTSTLTNTCTTSKGGGAGGGGGGGSLDGIAPLVLKGVAAAGLTLVISGGRRSRNVAATTASPSPMMNGADGGGARAGMSSAALSLRLLPGTLSDWWVFSFSTRRWQLVSDTLHPLCIAKSAPAAVEGGGGEEGCNASSAQRADAANDDDDDDEYAGDEEGTALIPYADTSAWLLPYAYYYRNRSLLEEGPSTARRCGHSLAPLALPRQLYRSVCHARRVAVRRRRGILRRRYFENKGVQREQQQGHRRRTVSAAASSYVSTDVDGDAYSSSVIHGDDDGDESTLGNVNAHAYDDGAVEVEDPLALLEARDAIPNTPFYPTSRLMLFGGVDPAITQQPLPTTTATRDIDSDDDDSDAAALLHGHRKGLVAPSPQLTDFICSFLDGEAVGHCFGEEDGADEDDDDNDDDYAAGGDDEDQDGVDAAGAAVVSGRGGKQQQQQQHLLGAGESLSLSPPPSRYYTSHHFGIVVERGFASGMVDDRGGAIGVTTKAAAAAATAEGKGSAANTAAVRPRSAALSTASSSATATAHMGGRGAYSSAAMRREMAGLGAAIARSGIAVSYSGMADRNAAANSANDDELGSSAALPLSIEALRLIDHERHNVNKSVLSSAVAPAAVATSPLLVSPARTRLVLGSSSGGGGITVLGGGINSVNLAQPVVVAAVSFPSPSSSSLSRVVRAVQEYHDHLDEEEKERARQRQRDEEEAAARAAAPPPPPPPPPPAAPSSFFITSTAHQSFLGHKHAGDDDSDGGGGDAATNPLLLSPNYSRKGRVVGRGTHDDGAYCGDDGAPPPNTTAAGPRRRSSSSATAAVLPFGTVRDAAPSHVDGGADAAEEEGGREDDAGILLTSLVVAEVPVAVATLDFDTEDGGGEAEAAPMNEEPAAADAAEDLGAIASDIYRPSLARSDSSAAVRTPAAIALTIAASSAKKRPAFLSPLRNAVHRFSSYAGNGGAFAVTGEQQGANSTPLHSVCFSNGSRAAGGGGMVGASPPRHTAGSPQSSAVSRSSSSAAAPHLHPLGGGGGGRRAGTPLSSPSVRVARPLTAQGMSSPLSPYSMSR